MTSDETGKLKRELHQLYDDYRTTLLNAKYYSTQFVKYKRINVGIEIFLALTSSSAIGAWIYWRDGFGEVAWSTLGALTAILAVLKPILQFPKTMERYQDLFGNFNTLYYDLDNLVQQVRINQAVSSDQRNLWEAAKKRLRDLVTQEDPEAEQDKAMIRALSEEVNREIPLSSLWIPAEV